jgi:hypothetical protein
VTLAEMVPPAVDVPRQPAGQRETLTP